MRILIYNLGFLILLLCFINTSIFGQEISTNGEIYDFEISDVFHYTDCGEYGGGQDGFSRWINDSIVDKYYSVNNDTLFYIVNRNAMVISAENPEWTYQSYTYLRTITNLDSLIYSGNIDTVYSTINYFNGRLINRRRYTTYYTPQPYMPDSTVYNMYWVVGCGLVVDMRQDFPYWSFEEFRLKYYKKGDEEWGIPVLVLTSIEHFEKNPNILIYPNPVFSEFNIDLKNCDTKFYKLEIYTMKGELLMNQKLESGRINQVSLPELEKGLYILKLISEIKIYSSKIIKN